MNHLLETKVSTCWQHSHFLLLSLLQTSVHNAATIVLLALLFCADQLNDWLNLIST